MTGRIGKIFARFVPVLAPTLVAAFLAGCSASTDASNPSLNASLATPSIVEFGSVKIGSHRDTSIRYANTGTDTLSISSQAFSAPQFSLVDMGTQPFKIGPGGYQDVALRFAPLALADTAGVTGYDTIRSNGKAPSVAMRLHAGGIALVRNAGVASTVSFGQVPIGSCGGDTLYIRNSGNDTLRITSAIASTLGCACSDFFAIIGSSAIALGDSGTIILHFCPSLQAEENGTLAIISNATNTTSPVTLSGTGSIYTPNLGNSYTYTDQATDSLGQPTGPEIQSVSSATVLNLSYRGKSNVTQFQNVPSVGKTTYNYYQWEQNGDVSSYSEGILLDSVSQTYFGTGWLTLPFNSHASNVVLFSGDTSFTATYMKAKVPLVCHLSQTASYLSDTTLQVGATTLAASQVVVSSLLTGTLAAQSFTINRTDRFFYVNSIGFLGRTTTLTTRTVAKGSSGDGSIVMLQSYKLF